MSVDEPNPYDLFIWIEGIGFLTPIPARLRKVFFPNREVSGPVFLDYMGEDGIGPIDIYPADVIAGHTNLKFAVQINRESKRVRKIIYGQEYQKNKIDRGIKAFTDDAMIPLNVRYISKKDTLVLATTAAKINDIVNDPTILNYFEYEKMVI